MKDDNFIEEFAKYLVKHIIVRPIEEKDVQRHLRQNTGMFIQKVMEEFQLDTLDNSVIQKALRDLESAVRQLVDQENKDYQDWVDNYKDYDEPEEKPYGYKAELDNQDGSFDTIAITTDLTRDEFYKRLSRRYDMETVRIVPCYSKAELNESARTKNACFTSLRESSSCLTVQDIFVSKDGWADIGEAFISYCRQHNLINGAKVLRGYNDITSVDYDDEYGDDEGTDTADLYAVIDVDSESASSMPSGTYEVSLYGDFNSVFKTARITNTSNDSSVEITSKDFRYDEPSMADEIPIELVIDKLIRKYEKLTDSKMNLKESTMSSNHIKTDFDVDKDGFYLNYSADELKGWLYVDLAKDDVDVEYHWENGDYYGPENDSGPLSGGYYDRGYEIDDIHIPTEYMNEHFFDENDNEISKNEFLRLNNLSGASLSSYLNNAKESLSSEIEDYVYDNEEDFIQE